MALPTIYLCVRACVCVQHCKQLYADYGWPYLYANKKSKKATACNKDDKGAMQRRLAKAIEEKLIPPAIAEKLTLPTSRTTSTTAGTGTSPTLKRYAGLEEFHPLQLATAFVAFRFEAARRAVLKIGVQLPPEVATEVTALWNMLRKCFDRVVAIEAMLPAHEVTLPVNPVGSHLRIT